MFLEHFELNEQPFGVTADPRFLYLGQKHRAALNMLASAAQADRGVLMLTAEPGMGKTCLLFHYLQGLRDDSKTAFLFQTAGNSVDLLRYLLADLGLQTDGNDSHEMNERLNRALAARTQAGQRFILALDDAHELHPRGFQSPLFTGFDQPWMKLIQIVMAGRPQLAEYLAPPSMAVSREGISSCIRLTGFTPEETRAYMDHRLRVAGYAGSYLFTPDAQLLIAIQSRGVPRYINSLCFNSMWIAYRMGAKQVDSDKVREAVADLVVEAGNSEETRPFALNRIFAPLGFHPEPEAEAKPVRQVSRWAFSAVASIFAVLCLVVVSGAHRRTETYSPPAVGQPTVSLTVAPAPNASSAPASETMTNNSATATVPSASLLPAIVAQVAARRKDEIVPGLTSPAPYAHQFLTVVVEPHATLRHLSQQYLGRFDPETLAEICRLNPYLTDPSHIVVNAKIRLPLYLRRPSRRTTIAEADAATDAPRQEKP